MNIIYYVTLLVSWIGTCYWLSACCQLHPSWRKYLPTK